MIVLQGFPPQRATTNPYLVMLAESLEKQSDVEVINFSWVTALTAKYDVYHTHWPENLGQSKSRIKQLVRQLLTVAFLIRLKVLRIPVVRTVHNLERPSDLSWSQHRILDFFDHVTSGRVTLNRFTPTDDRLPASLIPHGRYTEWFSQFPTAQSEPGILSFVGLVRRYKGIEQLIESFEQTADPTLELRISGNPTSSEMAHSLQAKAAGDPRITLDLRFLSEEIFAKKITEAELVVLPYKFMHNSGGALAALSLGRPVLVPDNEVNRDLSVEVGEGWVHLFSEAPDIEDIQQTLQKIRTSPPTSAPNLSARNWDVAGTKHHELYQQVIALRTKHNIEVKK